MSRRPPEVSGLEKNKRSPYCGWDQRRRLAIQTGSRRALRSVGWRIQDFPRSLVTAIVREPPRLSRQLIMIEPSASSAAWASVVSLFTPVPTCHVSPWSLEVSRVDHGLPSAARYCAANTIVPSFSAMPAPGPLKNSLHAGSLTVLVILMGLDQDLPSSSLCTSTSCPVSSGVIPGPELFHARLPWLHRAAIQIRPVFGSTRIAGSPTPSWPCFGSFPMSTATRMGSQFWPPSVLRETPTSMFAGKSPAWP